MAIFRYLDPVGDGSGDKNANGDFSGAPVEFKIVPTAKEVFSIERMIVHVRDTSIDTAAYGATVAGALVNGIEMKVMRKSEVLLNLTDGVPIKVLGHWSRVCYDTSPDRAGGDNQFIAFRLTFAKSGIPIILSGEHGDRLVVILNDDFSHLIDHRFHVQGVQVT